ncbi:MAG: helicase HerA-like domain-containing protein [Gammaproteobacteria bacterium]
MTNDGILIGKGTDPLYLRPRLANRHGLIAGATGTGKTVSLQVLAEGFSSIGVPVFLADVKGDLAGLSQPGRAQAAFQERAQAVGREPYFPEAFPVIYWDLFGTQGHAVRATVSEMGPLLLSRLLELNDTQEGVMNVAFKVADDEGLLLLDFKDLRAILNYAAENAAQLRSRYGSVSPASIGAIQRRLLVLEGQGAEHFFGEPGLDIWDLMRHDERGRGYISVLAADRLIHSPRLYSSFLLWLLAELFEELPEVGDPDKPRLVFFFDEAHLLFDAAPRALVDKVEQVVRLIRSKGIGVYFVSQNPIDIPDAVLGQLGNRIQHALRAFTPRDQRAVRAAADTFRRNPKLDTAEAITALGVGEALVSTLDEKGIPTPVERALICPPASRLGPVAPDERARVVAASPVAGRYDQVLDRQSAYESLISRAAAEKREDAQALPCVRSASRGRARQSIAETMAKSVVRSVGSSLGRQIARGLLGALFKGR